VKIVVESQEQTNERWASAIKGKLNAKRDEEIIKYAVKLARSGAIYKAYLII